MSSNIGEIHPNYQITKWVNITDDGNPVPIEPKFSTEEMPYKFTAKDDDGTVYCYGIANNEGIYSFDVYEDLANGWGITQLEIYDRKTKQYIDAIS